jgi:hypothetical protein
MTGDGLPPKGGLDPAQLLRSMGSAEPPSEPSLRPDEAARRAARRRSMIIDAMVEVATTDLEHSVKKSIRQPAEALHTSPAPGVEPPTTTPPSAIDTGSLGVVAPSIPPRRLGAAATSNVLLALGLVAALAMTWRASSQIAPAVPPVPQEEARVGSGAYVHAQAGEVLVIGSGGPSVAPSPGGAGRALGTDERVATLASSQATIHLGAATVIVLSPTSELRLHKSEGPAQVCELPSGTAQFTMTRQQTELLRVRVPGGELSTSGASFRVSVDAGTPGNVLGSVSVSEGIVELTLDGRPPVILGGGDRWPAHQAAVSALPAAPAAPSAPSLLMPWPAGGGVVGSLPRGRADKASAQAPQMLLASQSSQLAAQNNLLAEALEAGKRGDVDAEAQTLDLFLSRYPQSPSAHDAVIARMRLARRAGDTKTAAREASRYLQSFPSGPLREEALGTLSSRQSLAPRPSGPAPARGSSPKGT